MCGIAGWVDYSKDISREDAVMERLSKTLAARGPDAQGEYKQHNAYLVHRRLIVVDPENGIQPMTRQKAGVQYTLVYNGELYNTEELRRELQGRGSVFIGHSDTEVLLEAYICWGEACLERLNGIYAFAVYNQHDRSLFMARDRIGVKPLFYHRYEGGLIFGSEIKTLLAHPHVCHDVDKEGLAQVLMLGPGRIPGRTAFRAVEELKPGCCAMLTPQGMRVRPYWQLHAKPHEDTLAQTIDTVRELLTDAIRRQLVSDVPLCTFLSGGLDSSIITAVAAAQYRSQGETLSTYSVDYTDNARFFQASYYQPNADRHYIDVMSRHSRTAHYDVVIDNERLAYALCEAVSARDLPGMADVDSSLLLFCRRVKERFTVAVSGECADEIFGGYPWYHDREVLFAPGFPWAQSTQARAKSFDRVKLGFDAVDYVDACCAQTVREADLGDGGELDRRMKAMSMLNFHWFMQTLLDRKDRMSMACGLEVRVPFCDHRIMEYAYNIPWEYKALEGREKGLVRKAMEDLLPPEITQRKKSPYPKTHHPAYMQAVKTMLTDIAQDSNAPLLELMSPAMIRELIATDCAAFTKPWYGQLMTAAQTLAYLVQLNFWLQAYGVNLV